MVINATGHNRSDKMVDLLWENNDPTAAFAAQPIYLNSGRYKMIYIVYKFATDVDKKCVITCPITSLYPYPTYCMSAIDAKTVYSRKFVVHDYFIDFSRGYEHVYSSKTPSMALGANYVIPCSIYGSY